MPEGDIDANFTCVRSESCGCNYRDSRAYTVPQIIDVLNGLLPPGFVLFRKDRTLIVWELENGTVPSNTPPVVTPDRLKSFSRIQAVVHGSA